MQLTALLTAKRCCSYSYITGLHDALAMNKLCGSLKLPAKGPVTQAAASTLHIRVHRHMLRQMHTHAHTHTHTRTAATTDTSSNHGQHHSCLSNCHSCTETALAIAASLRAYQTRSSQIMQVAAGGPALCEMHPGGHASPCVLQWWRCRCAGPCQH